VVDVARVRGMGVGVEILLAAGAEPVETICHHQSALTS